MALGPLIEHAADCGFAVKRNGVILLRTASETMTAAMGNGLVLLFGANAAHIDWAAEPTIRHAWESCIARCPTEQLEIVRVKAVELIR
jgi:hypothetical protein